MKIKLPLAGALMSISSVALAHPGHEMSGFYTGLAHPFTGLDHLLAMVAVGLWAAQWGGHARWQVPASFIALLCLGGIVGINGFTLPGTEWGVAASLVVFGVFVALGSKLSVGTGILISGVFAFFHGAAHGVEIPNVSMGFAYSMGFVVASALLHASGFLTGYATRFVPLVVRFAGAAIASTGAVLMSGI